MKHLQFFILITAAGLVLALLGCTKDNVLTPIQTTTDEQALQQEVTNVDSVADYSSSDESTIDDNGMRSPEYDGFAKVDADDLSRIAYCKTDC